MILVNSGDLSYLYSDGECIRFAKKGHTSETVSRDTIRVKIADNMIYLYKVDGTFEPLFSSLRKFSRDTLMERGRNVFDWLRSA
jgi:hypothetical protein